MSVVPQEEYPDRVARTRALMREKRVDGLIVTDPVSFYYYTGIKIPSWQKGRPSIFVLPLEGEPALVSWSGPGMFARLYGKPFPSWVADRRIYPEAPMVHEEPCDWGLVGVLNDRKLGAARLAIEMGDGCRLAMPLGDFRLIERTFPQATFVDSSSIIWSCRIIKSAWEQSCSRKAVEIGGRAWKRGIAELRPGITGRDIQARILRYYIEEGADIDSEPPMALGATGPGGGFQKGDILYLDGGCSYMGYRMDFTRRCVFGPPSARQLDEHNGMWGILFEVMDRMKPGVGMAELFELAQQRIAARGWKSYSDHPAKRIGHGIGLENEPPSMSPFEHRVLAPGMILTPEPKIETVEGLLNPEEHVCITPGGCEIYSTDPGWALHVV